MADEEQEQPKANGAAIEPIVVKLRKSIIANGDEINEITFREPTAGDIERVGNPIIVDVFAEKPMITFDSKLMTQMMSVLAAVPPSSIRLMHTKDWNNAAWRLANFF